MSLVPELDAWFTSREFVRKPAQKKRPKEVELQFDVTGPQVIHAEKVDGTVEHVELSVSQWSRMLADPTVKSMYSHADVCETPHEAVARARSKARESKAA